MLLTSYNICHYLLNKGHLKAASIVDGHFTVRMTHSRNNNFTINKEFEDALFVKQISTHEQNKIDTLRTEATCYWLAENDPAYASLKSFLPKFHDYDTRNHILTIGYISDAIDLDNFYHKHQQFPLEIAAKKAEILHSIHHNVSENLKEHRSNQLFRKGLPMVFFMVGKGNHSWLNDRTAHVQRMMELMTKDGEYVELLEKIKEEWEVSSLIHGDIKASNFLLNEDCLETGDYQLRLLDWEIADIGDPIWDVAAILQSYLVMWVFRETVGKGGATSQYGQPVGFPLEQMQASIRHFWNHYCELMEFSKEEKHQKLRKATRYCALKLIQSCLESSQYSPTLPPQSAMMLQLSVNILKSQEDAIATLFELQLEEV